MNAEKYLKRIGLSGASLSNDLESLSLLQKQHLLNVPFENLDIHWKRPISLDMEKFFDKIVGERRGGFCYELNGLYAVLLENIGFSVKLISARVANRDGSFGPEFDHLAILAEIGGETYLTDVGFGDFTVAPLRFSSDLEQTYENGVFMIREANDDYFEVVEKDGGDWKSCYIFTTKPRALSEFAGMCKFHQTSPESHFTRGRLCSQMLESGRKTLTDKKFIVTSPESKAELEIGSEEKFDAILLHEFLITPPLSKGRFRSVVYFP